MSVEMFVIPFAIQAIISLLGLLFIADDYRNHRTHGEKQKLTNDAKWGRIWLVLFIGSPLAFIVIPILMIVGLTWLIINLIQHVVPVITHEEN